VEWEAPAIVLDVSPFGESDALAVVLTEAHGRHRGLVRGGVGRRGSAVWQQGNVIAARWLARLADQLGAFSAELAHPTAALALNDPLRLAVLVAACAVAAGALPEREPHPRAFHALMRVLARLPDTEAALAELVRWELALLAELGYGLDLSRCAVTGAREGLAFVSPKSGRAVTAKGAEGWEHRLLRLPLFLLNPETPAQAADWRDGLKLTGHFLARDAFGSHHQPLPAARISLYDRIAALAAQSSVNPSHSANPARER